MMAEEIDESGIYREDFSTESDWEVFIAQLGEVCQKWDIGTTEWGPEFGKYDLYKCVWRVKTEKLELVKKDITVSYYEPVMEENENPPKKEANDEKLEYYKDLMSSLNSFSPNPLLRENHIHPLARCYGLRRFIVIHPCLKNRLFLTKMSEFSFFLSAASVVSAEVSSTVPMFIQIYDPKWNYFIGIGHGPSARTSFDLITLDQTPAHCRYLSGLLPMFKEKIKLTHIKPAKISVQNIYSLDKIRLRIPMYVPFSNSYNYTDEETDDSKKKIILSTTEFVTLPHGYFRDSYTETFAIYTWPEIPENIAMDSALNTVFVPSKAPKGSIYYIVHANSYLSTCLNDYQSLMMQDKRDLEHYLGNNFNVSLNVTEPKDLYLKQKRVYRKREFLKKSLPGPMNEIELQQMMNYLFPNSQSNDSLFTYPKNQRAQEIDSLRVKSAYPDSLVCRLSSLLATVNSHFGGKSGLAQLWAAFTRQLTYYWDNCIYIPGVATGYPDRRTCLLHQKLQMLNTAIQHYARRHNIEIEGFAEGKEDEDNEAGTGAGDGAGAAPGDDDNEEEEEFYECPEYDDESASSSSNMAAIVVKKSKSTLITEEELISVAMKPEGRLKRLGNLKLLSCDEPLYVPITQEQVPPTDDQLQSYAEFMVKMSETSPKATEHLLLPYLSSDMEAFKAANPKASIDDFIRWHSPKDWEETTDESGTTVGSLSLRMKAPGNIWQTTWNEAKSVPVSRQKPRFDDYNEALNVLDYLEKRNISHIYSLTVIPLLHSAILKLKDILMNAKVLDIFETQIEALITDLCYLSDSAFEDGSSNCEQILEKIKTLEEHFYRFKCFEYACGEVDFEEIKLQYQEFAKNGGYYNIIHSKKDLSDNPGGSTLPSTSAKFSSELKESLICKDYIIRIDGETTSSSISSTGPQFLRAIISGDKLRLCTAFTENTTFL